MYVCLKCTSEIGPSYHSSEGSAECDECLRYTYMKGGKCVDKPEGVKIDEVGTVSRGLFGARTLRVVRSQLPLHIYTDGASSPNTDPLTPPRHPCRRSQDARVDEIRSGLLQIQFEIHRSVSLPSLLELVSDLRRLRPAPTPPMLTPTLPPMRHETKLTTPPFISCQQQRRQDPRQQHNVTVPGRIQRTPLQHL